MSELNDYKTSDTALATYLKLQGAMITNTEVSGTRVTFCFDSLDRDLIIKYNSGKALVDPIEFSSRLKQLTQSARRIVKDNNI